jgi:xanthine dehydrogenase YagS FAD-binding subunit
VIKFPTTAAEAVGSGTVRAGGTDLQDRRKRGIAKGDLVDLRDVPGLDAITLSDQGLSIGARARIAALAAHPDVRSRWPLLAIAAGGLATPQIRAVATVGGNVLQATRCWYFRSPDFPCLRKGGATCFSREGDHRGHAIFDSGPCLAVHASTIGMALRAYDDATIVAEGSAIGTVEALYGAAGAGVDHHLEPGAVLTELRVGPGWSGEKAAYLRAIGRFEAEWPLVEVGVRLQVQDGVIVRSAVVAGAVASVPVRLAAVEAALQGRPAEAATWAAAAEKAAEGANPPPGAAYKLDLLRQTVLATLERAGGAA